MPTSPCNLVNSRKWPHLSSKRFAARLRRMLACLLSWEVSTSCRDHRDRVGNSPWLLPCAEPWLCKFTKRQCSSNAAVPWLNLCNTNSTSVLEKWWCNDVYHVSLVPRSVHQVLTVLGPPFPLLLLHMARAAMPMGSPWKKVGEAEPRHVLPCLPHHICPRPPFSP